MDGCLKIWRSIWMGYITRILAHTLTVGNAAYSFMETWSHKTLSYYTRRMDSRHEGNAVHSNSCGIVYWSNRVDTLDKLKATLPKLEKYTSQSCAEETFVEIYHWTFTYMKENEMRKVVDLDVPPLLQIGCWLSRLQLWFWRFCLRIGKIDMLDRLSSFSRNHKHKDMSSHSIKINGTCFTNSRVRWTINLRGIRILPRGLHFSTSMLNGVRNRLAILLHVNWL